MDQISEMIVFVAEDEQGNEGIVTMHTEGAALPMVLSDAQTANSPTSRLIAAVTKAREIAHSSGRTIKVLRFTTRQELLTIEA